MGQYPERKTIRLPEDGGAIGAFFVTICTNKRQPYFSRLAVGEGLGPPAVELSEIGKLAEAQLLAVPERYPSVTVDKYVFMPDHLHAILTFGEAGGASPSPTLSQVVCAYKSLVTRACKQRFAIDSLWQRSFYDHAIRNEKDYGEIWKYIDENPVRRIEKGKTPRT